MTLVQANDTVTYKSPRGDTERPADLVVTVGLDSNGNAVNALPPGRAGASASVPVVLSNEDAAVYSNGRVPLVSASGNKANASAAATLTPSASTTAYLSGFEVTGTGATVGLPATVTVTGILSGTLSYTYGFVAGALLENTPLIIEFNPPLPASAVNTAIVVTCPASGTGGTNNTVVAHGFYV